MSDSNTEPSSNEEENEDTPLITHGVDSQSRRASFASSVFNLMTAIMGSGILGLAYAMANTGIVGFCLLLVLVSALAAYSVHLLLKLCDQTGMNSYECLGEQALHKPGKVIVGCTILIQNIGAMSSYLFILKTEFPATIKDFLNVENTGTAWYEDGRILVILITLCVILPLALLPRVGFLGYTSGLAFLCMVYFTVVVVIKKWTVPCPLPKNVTALSGACQVSNSSDSECTAKLFVLSSKSAYAIPTMAFAFLCHTAVLPIYCELDRPSKVRMQRVANIGISLSFTLYLISALFGYLTFYAHVESELLQGYDDYLPRDVLVMTVRLAILLHVLLTVPLIHFPARKAAILLLCGARPISWFIHCLVTVSILGVVLMLAIFVPDIRTVFGVVGSTTSSCLLFVFPGLFYLMISRQRFRSMDYIGAALLVVFGLAVGAFSLIVIILTLVHGS